MKHYCITIPGNRVSEGGYRELVKSSKKVGNEFDIDKFEATTADYANVSLSAEGIKWTYPWEGETIDFASGLTLKSYPTEYKERRIACFIFH